MTVVSHTRWGPFVPTLSYPELLCRIGVLRAFCQVFVKADQPIHMTLWRVEHGETELVEEALVEFDALPALNIRNVLGAYAKHWKGPKPVKPQTERTSDAAL
jgi:hypothetical protein